nr:5-formyltetrahydrofolate cyclo-ligase [Paracoccus amoyensis]
MRASALAARRLGGDQAALTTRLISALVPFRGEIVAGYWPMRGEADPRDALAAHNGPICLPVVTGKAQPLIFRAWDDDDLVSGAYGTAHPADSAAILIPSVLIVPLAGFDRQGNRLGYGGGFYDRTLQVLRDQGVAVAIGLAFAAQELSAIPAEPYDQPLDIVVTDKELIRPSR